MLNISDQFRTLIADIELLRIFYIMYVAVFATNQMTFYLDFIN